MAVPDYKAFFQPLLVALADGQLHSIQNLRPQVFNSLSLTPEDLKERIPSGKQTYANHRFGWAKTYLSKAGLIDSPERGFCQITERGIAALDSSESVTNEYLSQFPEFVQFKTGRKAEVEQPSEMFDISSNKQAVISSNQQTPFEVIESEIEAINASVKEELLLAILKASPEFFENLVVDLMLAMGYGGSRRDAGSATQYTQDGGIDGIIKEDKLGLEMIYLQAKRYTNKTVGRPEIQAFAGALDMHRAKKGVFITTSTFSKEATEYVGLIEKRIVLVDSEQLTELMLSHDLGVSKKQIFEVKALDSDYFLED